VTLRSACSASFTGLCEGARKDKLSTGFPGPQPATATPQTLANPPIKPERSVESQRPVVMTSTNCRDSPKAWAPSMNRPPPKHPYHCGISGLYWRNVEFSEKRQSSLTSETSSSPSMSVQTKAQKHVQLCPPDCTS
jgi:hypothetical protein